MTWDVVVYVYIVYVSFYVACPELSLKILYYSTIIFTYYLFLSGIGIEVAGITYE